MSNAYSPANYAPVETRDLKHSPNCVFYVNGDAFFPGSRICISNRIRTFDGVKDELTKLLCKNGVRTGHVRNIYTPVGGTKVRGLDDLKDGQHYVAALNVHDKFEPLRYREIPERRRLPRLKGFKKIDISKIYTPVQHALEERLRKKSGRSYYLNEHRRGLRLRVHINGYNERPSCPVSIRYSDKDNFMKILQEIETTLNTQPVRKVYKIINQGGYAENFNEVTEASQLEHDDHVLILPQNDHKLQVKLYSLEGKNNFKVTTSPRAGQYYLYPSFPLDTNFKHNKSLNKHKPLPSIGSSKQSDAMSPYSNPPGSTGGRSVKNQKPKGARQVDYDKDEGGVYRAKKQNNARGAQQVNDTRETRTEKPIDQMEAEIVEEEQIKESKEKTTPIPPGTELNKQPSKETKQNADNGSQTKKVGEVKKGGKASNKDSNKVGVLPPIVDESVNDKKEIKDGHVKEIVDKIEQNSKQNGDSKREVTPKDLKSDDVVEELQRVATPTDLQASEVEANKPPKSTSPPEGKVSRASGPDKERVNEDAAMNRIDEYDDSFNRYDQNTSGGMTKDPRSSTPASRGEARRKQEQREHEAAAKIQAGARGYKARKEYKAKKEARDHQREEEDRARQENERRQREAQDEQQQQKKQMDEDMAASKIQAGFKGYKQRKEYNLKKQQVRESPNDKVQSQKMTDNEAAIKIQSGYKGYKVRKEYKARKGKIETDEAMTDINKNETKVYSDAERDAAIKIQSGYRGYKVRKDYKYKKKESEADKNLEVDKNKAINEDKAAATIQAGYKGYRTRKEYAKRKAEKAEADVNKTDTDKSEDEAARKIQASYKGYKARKEYATKKKEKEEHNAASRIQASFRGYQERKKIGGKKKEPQLPDQAPSPKEDMDQAELDKAATKIQSGFRGYKTRKEFKAKVINEHVMETDHDQLPESAVSRISVKKGQFIPGSRGDNASKIQSAFRVLKMKKLLGKGGDVFWENRYAEKREERGKLVAAFRGYMARKTEKEFDARRNQAAAKIQAQYRGYRTRQTKFYPIRLVNFLHAAVRGYVTRKLNNIQTLARAKIMSVPNGGKYASVIQALCRGFLTRHRVNTRRKQQKSATSQGPTVSESPETSKKETEGVVTYWKDTNIKMYSDKTIRKAAARIQAAIYAFKTRQFYQKLKFEREEKTTAIETNRNDANLQIQACFKGYLNRKKEVGMKGKKDVGRTREEKSEKEGELSREKGEKDTAINEKSKREKTEPTDAGSPKIMPTPPRATPPSQNRPSSRVLRPESGRPRSRPASGRPVSARPMSARPTSARPVSGQTRTASRPTSRPRSTTAQRGSSGKTKSHSDTAASDKGEGMVADDIVIMDMDSNILKEGTIRSSTRLSGTANSLRSETLLSLSDTDKEKRKGSGKSYSTWKSSEKLKSSGGEVEREGESLREIEDDAGELSSIEKNVNAVGQLQAAFRAYRLRREISELLSGGAELMDIRNVDRAVSALRKDFRLRSAKVRRLGSLQYGRDKPVSPGQQWWENTNDDEESDVAKRRSGGDDSLTDSGSSKSDASPRDNNFDETEEANNTRYEQRRARQQIEAAYRGFRTRMTERRARSAQNQRVRHESRAGSGSTSRTVYHVQMHSDVINERCTRLQAAFAGYQTRKVFMSLTKLVEMNAQSDHNTSEQEFERMGSLSETDDFKLRHKSIAKIQAAYESYRLGHESRMGQRLTFKGDQLPSVFNKNMVLPPIPQNIQVGQGSTSRPWSGVTRSELEVLPLPEGKSKTLPDLYHRYGHFQGKNLNNIEVYIRKKTAASILQAYARGFLTRQKFKKKQAVKPVKESRLNASISSKGSEKSRRRSPVSTGRKTPGSMASRMSKVSSKTSPASEDSGKKRDQGSRNREDKTMSEMVRQRTASIKLEAERRKVVAEQVRLKQQNDTKTPEVVASGTVTSTSAAVQTTEKRESPRQNEGYQSPHRLSPIPSSRLQTERQRDRNDLIRYEEQAAVKIQKVFRGYRTRQELDRDKVKTEKKAEVMQENEDKEIKKIKPATDKEHLTSNVKKQLDGEYTTWRQERQDAAVAIQSVWRGYAIRKGKLQPEEMIKEDFSHLEADRGLLIINIGRSKSEIERANQKFDHASMIQMIFRGCKIRRRMAIKASKRRYEKNKAASKIQGLYQGFLTRFKLKECKSATRIQSIFKAYLARDNMIERQRLKEEQRQKAASRLQAAYLSFQKRRENEALKKERALHKAASEIQTVVKGFMSRWEGARRREEREMMAANRIHAAIKGYKERKKNVEWRAAGSVIMAVWMSYKARKAVQAYRDKLEAERKAASRLQAAYRAYLVRHSNREYKEKMARQNKAATKIQCCLKGRRARIAYKKHKEMVERQRQSAAVKIQSVYRGHLGRKIARKEREVFEMNQIAEDMVKLIISRSVDYVRRRDRSSERIQATVKAYCSRRLMTIKLCDEAKLRNKCATVIQAAVRALIYRTVVAREKTMAARKAERGVTASIIQAVVRAKQARNQQERRKQNILMNEAAVKIQAMYRGYHTRKEIEREKEMLANLEPPPTVMISARTLSGRLLRIPVDDMLLKNSRAIILFHKKATDLQAAFRGYRTREEMKDRYVRKTTVVKHTPRRVLSISKRLTPEDEAAVLIQKTFRGYWNRKVYQMATNQRKKERNSSATNIQAAVKGFRVRLEESLKREKLREAGLGELWRQKQEAANIISCAFRSFRQRKAKIALRVEM